MSDVKEKKKRRSKRSMQKYPALDPKYNLKTRRGWLDFDYLDKLTDEEKEWLNSVMEEENNASFNHNGIKISTDGESRRASYARNNSRNRCIYTREDAQGTMNFIEDALKENPDTFECGEDDIINAIDYNNAKDDILDFSEEFEGCEYDTEAYTDNDE